MRRPASKSHLSSDNLRKRYTASGSITTTIPSRKSIPDEPEHPKDQLASTKPLYDFKVADQLRSQAELLIQESKKHEQRIELKTSFQTAENPSSIAAINKTKITTLIQKTLSSQNANTSSTTPSVIKTQLSTTDKYKPVQISKR